MATTAVGIQANYYTASALDRSPTTTSLPPPSSSPTAPGHHLQTLPFPSLQIPTSEGRRRPPRRATRTDGMSHRLVGRVVSDLSHSTSRSATDHRLHHRQSTTTSSNDGGSASKAKQKLALLFSGVVAWTRTSSEGGGETGNSANSTRQQSASNRGSGTGARRRGLEIVLAVRKYVAMLEQLFASYSGGSSRRDGDSKRDVRRRRPHTFTSGRHGGGGTAAAQSSSSKRHKGRLSSAPASLRGSPANSGHLAVGESVMTKTSTSSEVSTMEELQSAIQAAIAHCKNSRTSSVNAEAVVGSLRA